MADDGLAETARHIRHLERMYQTVNPNSVDGYGFFKGPPDTLIKCNRLRHEVVTLRAFGKKVYSQFLTLRDFLKLHQI